MPLLFVLLCLSIALPALLAALVAAHVWGWPPPLCCGSAPAATSARRCGSAPRWTDRPRRQLAAGDRMKPLLDLRAHIDRLITDLRITRFPDEDDLHVHWIDDREEAMAINAAPVEIHLPHIRSALDYATCLHELGHVSGRYQNSKSVKTRERWAWQYAREHALGLDRGNGRRRTGVPGRSGDRI